MELIKQPDFSVNDIVFILYNNTVEKCVVYAIDIAIVAATSYPYLKVRTMINYDVRRLNQLGIGIIKTKDSIFKTKEKLIASL
jgi:hypothetical protein